MRNLYHFVEILWLKREASSQRHIRYILSFGCKNNANQMMNIEMEVIFFLKQ